MGSRGLPLASYQISVAFWYNLLHQPQLIERKRIFMAHLEKFKATQVTAICKHDSRQQGDGVEHSNESIENERTHLNYNLASEQQSLSATAFLKERLSECRVLKRADVNVMCSWAVTLPKDFEGDERKFFKESYDFLCKRYGEENVVSAWVHMDENQPHLHFKFIPVTQGKDGADKVSAKEVVNRSDLRSFHTDLQKHLENALQCPCNVLNGATDNGNKTIQQLKAEALQAKCEALNSTLTSSQKKVAYAEQSLEITNKKIEVAAEQLKKTLDKKSRASEIHRSLFDRETQSYHINMLESTRAIGSEAYNEVQKANKTLQQAVEVQARVTAMQQNIVPLHQQAVAERDKAKKLRENEERLIEVKAQELSERKVNEVLGGIPSKERDRMRKFMDGLQFQDGSTALEHFENQEIELKKSAKRGLGR